jgi:hypothetical protein
LQGAKSRRYGGCGNSSNLAIAKKRAIAELLPHPEIIDDDHTLHIPKTVAITFLANGTVLIFFAAR